MRDRQCRFDERAAHLPGHGQLLRRPSTMRSRRRATRMRHELRPFGVHVSLIQPGMVKTGLGRTAVERRVFPMTTMVRTPTTWTLSVETTMTYQDGPMARLACEASDVAVDDREECSTPATARAPLPRRRFGPAHDSPHASCCPMRPSTIFAYTVPVAQPLRNGLAHGLEARLCSRSESPRQTVVRPGGLACNPR